MKKNGFPYWLEVPLIRGSDPLPQQCQIAVIGSGLSGSSAGYFLSEYGFDDLLIVDSNPEEAATNRNCGHILYGTVESMMAFCEFHGEDKAKELWGFSIEICDLVGETVHKLGMNVDYRQDGYLIVAIDETENKECQKSVELLNRNGFESSYLSAAETRKLGFRHATGARHEKGSAQAHPVKFRNALIQNFQERGGRYSTGPKVISVDDLGDSVSIRFENGHVLRCEAAVIAANAYSPLVSKFFETRRLIEPFRGQIITSAPLKHEFKVKYPHSFDHGYEYALVTEDNRLMIGGWRNNSPTKEVGTYDLTPNDFITKGLQDFVGEHYDIKEKIQWEYSWAGIMGSSSTSLPFIGPTNSDRVFSCAGYTGHGFSWAHGSARLLAQIMSGSEVPMVARHFNPKITQQGNQ
ncbi:MAG: FAD-binding oxidoreductase [Bdellovibrionales bacterium]|nr:FAD-binding oxidoreductase [Bdellovibrionales bacterium]